MNINKTLKHRYAPYLFISPFLVIFFALNFYPLLVSLFISLNEWKMGSELAFENMTFDPVFNYNIAITHPLIKEALINTTLVALSSVVIVHTLALVFSKLILSSFNWLQGLLLVMLFAPFILSETSLADSYINGFWSFRGWVEANKNAEHTFLFGKLMHDYLPTITAWFWSVMYNRHPAMYVVFVLSVKYIGFFTLVYTMVLRTVSQDIKDAAFLEGAGNLRVFFQIEIPSIRAMLLAMLVLSFIFFVQSSDVSVYLKNHRNGLDIGVTYFSLMMKMLNEQEFGPAASLSWVFISTLVSLAILIIVFIRRKLIVSKLMALIVIIKHLNRQKIKSYLNNVLGGSKL